MNEKVKTDDETASPLQSGVICGFNEAWIGDCKTSVAKEGDRCFKHTDLTCGSCGAPATHTCAETGQFVCGAPLCDDCEHTIVESGNNGGIGFNAQAPPEGMKSHCKKTEQRYKPWHAREEASI